MQAVRAVARLVVVVGALALGAAPAAAGSGGGTPQDNCPAGFVWIRMSGTGCVQAEPLPAHGKIGYDGHAICNEPYVGLYEQRATTDGQPAPGTPYTSFAYLLSCVAQADYEQAVAELAEESGGTLSVTTVAGLSVLGGAVVLGGSAVMLRRRGGPRPQANPRVPEINARLAELAKERADLDAKAEQLRRKLNRKEWNASDINEILGVVTSLIGLGATAEAARLGTALTKSIAKWTGVVSSVSTGAGLVTGADDLRDLIVESLEKIGLQQGEIESEQATLHAELDDLTNSDPPDRLMAESYTDPDVLQARIDEVKGEISDLQRQRNGYAEAQLALQRDLDGIQQSTNVLHDFRIEFERRQDVIADWGKKNAMMALAAGIVALGVTGPLTGLALASLGTASSLASFTAWWAGASAGDRREAIALGLQGNALLRGTVLNQIDQARAQEQALATQIQTATDYKGRLRAQHTKLTRPE